MSKGKIELFNCDNMELMAKYPDKHFDLAIVDPPYGIDMAQELFKRGQAYKKTDIKNI